MQQWWMLERSYLVTSSWSINRNMVGGAQKVVTLYFSSTASMSLGTNFSKS